MYFLRKKLAFQNWLSNLSGQNLRKRKLPFNYYHCTLNKLTSTVWGIITYSVPTFRRNHRKTTYLTRIGNICRNHRFAITVLVLIQHVDWACFIQTRNTLQFQVIVDRKWLVLHDYWTPISGRFTFDQQKTYQRTFLLG